MCGSRVAQHGGDHPGDVVHGDRRGAPGAERQRQCRARGSTRRQRGEQAGCPGTPSAGRAPPAGRTSSAPAPPASAAAAGATPRCWWRSSATPSSATCRPGRPAARTPCATAATTVAASRWSGDTGIVKNIRVDAVAARRRRPGGVRSPTTTSAPSRAAGRRGRRRGGPSPAPGGRLARNSSTTERLTLPTPPPAPVIKNMLIPAPCGGIPGCTISRPCSTSRWR